MTSKNEHTLNIVSEANLPALGGQCMLSSKLTLDHTQQFMYEICDYISKFGVNINCPIVDSKFDLHDVSILIDYACYLDNQLSPDCNKLFFLTISDRNITRNPFIKRDMVLLLYSHIKNITSKIKPTNENVQIDLILLNQAIISLASLAFTDNSNPESLDDLVTYAFILLIIVANHTETTEVIAEICESSPDHGLIQSNCTQLLVTLDKIRQHCLPISVFKTYFGDIYKGFNCNFEQLELSSNKVLHNFKKIIEMSDHE